LVRLAFSINYNVSLENKLIGVTEMVEKFAMDIRDIKISPFEIETLLNAGEATKIGAKAKRGNKRAMQVIATYVLWQNGMTEKAQADFVKAYIKYKVHVNESAVLFGLNR
jgi:hypothetical protein